METILGVVKKRNNIKVLVELGRLPLYVNIPTQMVKLFHLLPFIDNERYLYKVFQSENLQKEE